ncbi:unnamed protein product [Sphenostylis stenocarpa]|uniref:Histone H2A/H2B/H3 domain-containing protein n=1 Tax=Sphenostylis stenocarpa TaxID=92480 RepID=A0AA86VN24_9FABA|nr:unnamed protein product [Sphenostylis stenocarpa]
MARVKHTPASRKVGMSEIEYIVSHLSESNPDFLPYANSKVKKKLHVLPHPQHEGAEAPETQRRKKARSKPGTAALREIRHFQKSCKLLIPAAPFLRCVIYPVLLMIRRMLDKLLIGVDFTCYNARV